ncbi:hypothetical protein [Roseobacter phage RDJL6]|nr:hypothetical protein [Roseobacter phage RDJL6]
MTTQFDAVETFETMTAGKRELVGLYQEVRLSQDEDGGEDGMWFDEAVQKVEADVDATVKFVADNWPHGSASVEAVRNTCDL